MTKRLFTIFLLSTLISGCGFALRGNITLPDAVKTIAVLGDNADFVADLEDMLRDSEATVTTAENENAAVLDLGEILYEREVSATDSNGRAISYTLKYEIEYQLTSAEGETLQEDQRIIQSRFINYDPLQELQSQEEEEFLQEEMREEIILQLLRRLTRV